MSVSTSPRSTAVEQAAADGWQPAPAAAPGLRLTGRRLRELGRPFRTATIVTVMMRVAITATRIATALLVAGALGRVLHHHGAIGPLVVVATALAVVRLAALLMLGHHVGATADTVRRTLRRRLYTHLTRLGPSYLVRHRTGSVETVLVDGVDRLGGYYAGFVPLAWASTIGVAAVLVWVAALDPISAVAMLAAAVLVPLAPVVTARAFGDAGRRFADGLGRLAAEYLDAIQGLLTLKVFDAAPRWGERLDADNSELAADATSLAGLATIHVGFVSLGMAAGTVLAVALAIVRTTHHRLSGAALLAIVLLARECFRPLGELQDAFPAAYDAAARANGVFDLLDAPIGPAAPTRPVTVDRRTLQAALRFDDVTFSYREERAPALDHVTFAVAPGETVALVGPSGAGKSTVVSLLLRFFDPATGTISLGGYDIATLDPAHLRSLISVTFQESYLFHRSIADNLRLARPDATDADVEAAARAANAHEFIAGLPEGYGTVVHERGARLSGGERQRLTLARALLSSAPVLVLDEPTSGVDAVSESMITDALARLAPGRTTLLIAHRLSTIVGADRVVVLEGGRVVETGRPDELGEGGGAFARLVRTQAT